MLTLELLLATGWAQLRDLILQKPAKLVQAPELTTKLSSMLVLILQWEVELGPGTLILLQALEPTGLLSHLKDAPSQ